MPFQIVHFLIWKSDVSHVGVCDVCCSGIFSCLSVSSFLTRVLFCVGFLCGFLLVQTFLLEWSRVTFWVISLQASFIVHRFWTSFCIRSLCAFTSQRFSRFWIPNILEFSQETLLSCCFLCFYPVLGPSPAPGSYLWADHVTFHRQEHTAWLPIFFFFIEVQLIYNVLVSGMQQSDSVIYIHICVCVCVCVYVMFFSSSFPL